MYRTRLTSDSFQSVRDTLTAGYRQVKIEGIEDSVGVGFVREFGTGTGPLPAGYIVFTGKKSKASHHFSAKNIAEAEQRVDEILRAAQWVVNRKAEDRKKVKQPATAYTEHTDREITVRSYSLAATAGLIRQALKAAFPAVKFSVTTDRFAGGTALDIRYTDGPSRQQVKAVYAPFISGHFDSMQDMHVYNGGLMAVGEEGKLVRLSYGAKYIDCHRDYSAPYGFCLNALDLREVPSLTEQFTAFEALHILRESQLETSYCVNNGTHTLTSTTRKDDLEKFAAMLTAQGHTPTLTQTDSVQTLTVTDANSPAAQVQPAATAAELATDSSQDTSAAEFEATERFWHEQNTLEATAAEFAAAELHWHQQNEAAELPPLDLPWLN
jgi:hypothetical protein